MPTKITVSYDNPTDADAFEATYAQGQVALARALPGIVKFETSGDADQTSKLLVHGGKGGAFVAEIRAAVTAGRLHAAMHSLKDMPGNEDTPGLVIGATLLALAIWSMVRARRDWRTKLAAAEAGEGE